MKRVIAGLVAAVALLGAAGTWWVASPPSEPSALAAPLQALGESQQLDGAYAADFPALSAAFRPQEFRSFCGPATLATILRAMGQQGADQRSVLPSLGKTLKAFYGGMSLAELDAAAKSAGLKTQLVYADAMTVETFREHLKANLTQRGDFVVVNYDRRVLNQKGIGHISALGAYDANRDAFLVLDEAAYSYPFTWVPAPMLFAAVHTQADAGWRGVLFIAPPSSR